MRLEPGFRSLRTLTFLATAALLAAAGQAVAAIPTPREYSRFALLQEGDVAHGRALFADAQRLACSLCHSTDGSASKAGPDLFAAGDSFARSELIEAILVPSAKIAPGYDTVTIETTSGDSYHGVLKQANGSVVELMGADGVRVPLARKDITTQTTSETSLMPQGLQNSLSLQEFADLIEYLVSLKQPQNSRMLEAGMPPTITELALPVDCVPFLDPTHRFDHPVWFGSVPGESNVFFVVEHESGRIWRLEVAASETSKTMFAELGGYDKGTRGLLGLALHPHFHENGKYYFARHAVENGRYSTRIFEREADERRKVDSGRASRLVLKMDETSNVHYGGGLQFGPDGYFYIGMGDSGPQEDPNGNAQNQLSFLGKILRIDVDHPQAGRPYRIPDNNPFRQRSDIQPEIWALGLREPWRFSFDSRTGDLWVGDVGQDRYEEVDLVHPGQNYGWNVYEGFEPFSNRYRRPGEQYAPPVFAYGRKFGVSVTGGFVYRGDAKSSFYGVYVFGDYQSRRLFGLTQQHGVLQRIRQIGLCPEPPVSFGCDPGGNLYAVGYAGMIYRLNFAATTFN